MDNLLKAAIKEYTNEVQNSVTEYMKALWKGKEGWEKQVERIDIKVGRKYVKVIRCNNNTGGQSVYGFIKIEDGSLWKAAGWNGPARNFSRGNVYDDVSWNINPFSIS